jgi:L-Ala-D/L-Glu epimerase / N-acetyl-D-glutamate racemase
MRIERATIHHLRIPLRKPFEHALHRRSEVELVVVRLQSSDGCLGYGEIAPRSYLTGESIATTLEDVPALIRDWMRRDIEPQEHLVQRIDTERARCGRKLAAFAGVELALLDVAGTHFGFSVADIIGETDYPSPPGGVVIGFEVETPALPRHCGILRTLGHQHVKVKVGREDDLERVMAASTAFGPHVQLRLDANGAWSAPRAIEVLRSMQGLPIHSIEQPCTAGDLEGLRSVRAETGLRVMADESLASHDDAVQLIAEDAVDLFNIRVGKCGGLLGSLRILELAHEAGVECHLGTLVGETGILSAAGEIFARRAGRFPCLEGKGQNHFLLAQDILATDTLEDATNQTGLGIGVDEARLTEFAVATPVHMNHSEGIAN